MSLCLVSRFTYCSAECRYAECLGVLQLGRLHLIRQGWTWLAVTNTLAYSLLTLDATVGSSIVETQVEKLESDGKTKNEKSLLFEDSFF